MLAVETLVTVGTLALLAEHGVRLVDAHARPDARRSLVWAPLLACAVAIALRLAIVPPSFTHDNFHAVELVDTMLGDEAHNPRVDAYGHAGFALLSALTRLLGARASTILVANLTIGVLASWAFGAVFARAYRRPELVAATILCAALFPPLARSAYSEDLHGLAAFYGASSVLFLDAYVRARRTYDAALAVIAATLMLLTRQTFIPFAPFVVALVASAHGRRRLVDGPALVPFALVLAGALARTIHSLTNATDAGAFETIRFAYSDARVFAMMLGDHWALAPTRLGWLLVPALALGLREAGGSRIARVHAAALIAFFFLTLPFHRPNPGAELCMRAPFAYLSIGYLALAASAIGRGAARPLGRRRAVAVVAIACVIAPLATPSARRDLAYQSIEYQEYAYVEAAVHRLPRVFTLVEPEVRDGVRHATLARRVFALAGREVRRTRAPRYASKDAPILLFEGLRCWAYTAEAVYGIPPRSTGDPVARDAALRRMVDELFLDAPRATRVPDTMHPECAALVASGRPSALPPGTLTAHEVAPFALFGRTSIPLRFHDISPR